mmetsp:Transcript_28489/g.75082  ORF Transcript_28489/g.75082 Transcript_28489/m.75082 type:complete len:227 (+) Transcript_28489:99-779(+)
MLRRIHGTIELDSLDSLSLHVDDIQESGRTSHDMAGCAGTYGDTHSQLACLALDRAANEGNQSSKSKRTHPIVVNEQRIKEHMMLLRDYSLVCEQAMQSDFEGCPSPYIKSPFVNPNRLRPRGARNSETSGSFINFREDYCLAASCRRNSSPTRMSRSMSFSAQSRLVDEKFIDKPDKSDKMVAMAVADNWVVTDKADRADQRSEEGAVYRQQLATTLRSGGSVWM